MKKNSLVLIVSVFVALSITACKKQSTNTTETPNENELITTVSLNFIDSVTSDTFTFNWKQLGGPGTAITVDTIKLKPGNKYLSYIEILDESKTPIFKVSDEIKEEANDHRFIYESSTSRLSTKILDVDTHVPPIELGLMFETSTNNIGEPIGTFQVLLKHYTESSPKMDGLTAGTTDIEVFFPQIIQ